MQFNVSHLVLLAVAWSCAAHGHHSVGGQFDQDIRITFDVEVIEYTFANPHPYMIATRTAGANELITLDMDNRREFTALNIDETTFVPGDKLTVVAFPSRTESATFYLAVIEHPRLKFRYETNVRHLIPLE